jgi:hypothetical protein
MDTNENTRLLLKDEVYQIVGAAMEVLKLRVGMFLNFAHAKLEWERIVL